MTDEPIPESDDEIADDPPESQKLDDIWQEAMERFDSVALPQQEVRALMLRARRFSVVSGAQWDGVFDADAEQVGPRPEIDLITQNTEKVEEDYRQNRMTVDFQPVDGADQETANTLDDMFRADSHVFKAQHAWDNAFSEGLLGGMGAWRMSTDYADHYDPDNDSQRILPGIPITDADQTVYFGPHVRYDASDAPWCIVLTAKARAEAEKERGSAVPSWPMQPNTWDWGWQWFQPDVVYEAEYYVVEDAADTLLIFTMEATGEERRFYESEIASEERRNLTATGWKLRTRKADRRRVHKYLMNGDQILRDYGYIAGEFIPVVPFYGRVNWINNVQYIRGYTQKKMDAQTILNTGVARVMETDSYAPFEVPIVNDEQLTPAIAQEWAEGNVKRTPFRRLMALRNPDGTIANLGTVGKIDPPQVAPTTAALLQFSVGILREDDDKADEVKANVSADAMEMAADRVDAKSGIYMDNMRQSMARCGEIYRSMARDVYFEPGREVQTRSADGRMGNATLHEPAIGSDGVFKMHNDLSRGVYHVEASVQESTSSKRAKAMRRGLELSQAFIAAQSPQDALAALYTAAENMDGEGVEDLIQFYRSRSIAIGATKPSPEEAKQLQDAAQNQQPDPANLALTAQAAKLGAEAKQAEAGAVLKLADAHLKNSQADALGGPEKAPDVPSGLQPANDLADVHAKLAGAELHAAQARKIDHDMTIGTHDAHVRRIATGRELALKERAQEHAEKQPRTAA